MQRRTVQDPQRTSSPTPHGAVRGTVAKLGLALVTAGAGLLALAPPGGAQTSCADAGDDRAVLVVEVDGLVDPVLADLIDDQVARAEEACALALVLQFDSGGAVVSDGELDNLVATIEDSSVPVGVWIGPSGSKATGGAVRTVDLDLVDNDAPTILEYVVQLEGFETEVVDGQRQPVTDVTFGGLSLTGQLMHTVASPAVAYLLFSLGLALLLFELFTAGVGIAGMVGAGSLVLGCYGLAVLPTRPIGVALLLFAVFGYGIDVQTGVPRLWTGIATASFVLGSLFLFDGVSVSWVTLLIAIVGMTLGVVAGMPTMVRSRFSTPTIGRDWMIGELGSARTDIDPDGVIPLRDAPWRARTNRATPIRKDEPARVVAIEGLVLEVEPTEGAARDYRERATDD